MNDFKRLTLDDLVEISGETDEFFDANFELGDDGYYKKK